MIFLTGFPGFVGTRLLRRLVDRFPDKAFALLIQPKFEEKARRILAEIGLSERAILLPGDITQADLGLEDRYDEWAGQITHAFHLAAVYDLAVPREVGWRVNVEGTRHVLDFLERCSELELFAYVSTAYVSGRRTGGIKEDELVHDAGFKNYYEETKYHAEVLVQERSDDIPTVIFRPSIIVGDSRTGATDKFDGPYFVIRVLRRLPRYTLMTRLGSGNKPVNLVPVDFVTRAIAELSTGKHAGAVFHLTDPNPLTTQEIITLFVNLLDMYALFVPVPVAVARTVVGTPFGLLLGLTPQLVDYFDAPSYYDQRHAERALQDTDIRCPRLPEYAPQMIDFLKKHEKQLRSEAMY